MYSNLKFKTFIVANNIDKKAFAKEAGLSLSSVYSYLNDNRNPDDEAKFKIAKATKGAVLPNDWFDLTEIFSGNYTQ